MRPTPIPLVAVLALACTGSDKPSDSGTTPTTDETTFIPPMVPPDSGDTSESGGTGTTTAPMPPPDSGVIVPPMAYPVDTGTTGGPAGLSPLPSVPPLAR